MTVRVALPSRGRLRDGVLSLLDDAGYPAAVLNGAARAATPQTEFIEMRPRDAGAWLATGRIAGAFISTDIVLEEQLQHLTAVPLAYLTLAGRAPIRRSAT